MNFNNFSYSRFLKSTQLSEAFFLQNVIETKCEFLSQKVISVTNGKPNSKKNIYILRENKNENQRNI